MSTKKKLAIAGGVGVIAAGAVGVMYGRSVLRGGPKNVTKTVPPQAKPDRTPLKDPPPWQIGDKVYAKPGDVIEVSLKNKIAGKGYTRFYGELSRVTWGRHTEDYHVDVRGGKGNGRLLDTVKDFHITGVKVGGAANLSASVQALQDERKRHRY